MSESIVRTHEAGLRFLRGSRREMLIEGLRSTFQRRCDPRKANHRGYFWALRDVSLDLREGSRLAVCGANGSGKTTLMRLLGGIYRPDEGTVEVNGTTSAMLSLGAGISHQLSGRDNVYLTGSLYGLSEEEISDRYEEIRAFAELDENAMRTPVRYFSSGMRSRLGFSIVASISPEILIIDEVLAVGDMAFRKKSSERLKQCAEKTRCVVISSHSISFLREHCDVAIWLHEGRVLSCGDAKPVLDEYVSFMADRD